MSPGTGLSFCGPETYVEYLGCVSNLIAAGATILSDDLTWTGVDVMSAPTQNPEGAALTNILRNEPDVMVFHAVGNQAAVYWQGSYAPVPASARCNGQLDNYLEQFGNSTYYVTWQTSGGNDVLLASNISAGQTTGNEFDVYVVDSATSQLVTCSTSANGWVDGSTSYTVVDGSAIPTGTYLIFVGTPDSSLNAKYLKLIGTDDAVSASFAPMTTGAPASPQDFAAGVITVEVPVTVTAPSKPTITITDGGTQSVLTNGTIAPVTFKVSGTGPLTFLYNTNDIPSVSITPGCGTTTMSCVATLSAAEGVAGTATLSLTVEDSYLQTTGATATIKVTAPSGSGGGGGALDRWTLWALGGFVLGGAIVQSRRLRERRYGIEVN